MIASTNLNIPEPALLMACISSKLVCRLFRKPSQEKLQRKPLWQTQMLLSCAVWVLLFAIIMVGFNWAWCRRTFDCPDLVVCYGITVHLHQWAQEVSLWHHPLGWLPTDLLVAAQHQDALTNHLHLFGWLGKGSAQWTSSKRQIEGEDRWTDGRSDMLNTVFALIDLCSNIGKY